MPQESSLKVRQTDESTLHLEPHSKDESALVGMLFEKITTLYPDWKMSDRTDLAMTLFSVVKQWAHDMSLTSKSHETALIEITGEVEPDGN